MRVSNRLHSVSEANISCSIGSRPQLEKKKKKPGGGREGGREELPEHLNDLFCLRFIYKSQSSEVRVSLASTPYLHILVSVLKPLCSQGLISPIGSAEYIRVQSSDPDTSGIVTLLLH